MDGGQLQSTMIYEEDADTVDGPEVASAGSATYVIWYGDNEEINFITSSDNWDTVRQIASSSSSSLDMAAGGKGRLTILLHKNGFVYLAESEDGGNNWRETALGVSEAEYGDEREYLRVFISQLRRKIEDNPYNPYLMLT